MRVLVCGGRNYRNKDFVAFQLDHIRRGYPHDTMVVIQGGATGADQLAREWCAENEVEYWNFPANWKAHGKSAGPIRNQEMIERGQPHLVLAFPGGSGTADMVRRAKAAHIEVIIPGQES